MIYPRLKTSKKWTAFPKDYAAQIEAVFKENFAADLDAADIIVEGRIYQDEVLLRVGYLEKGRLTQANFEISANYSREKMDALQKIHGCVDAAASMMADYLENEGTVDFPYTWKEIDFQGQKLFMQFNTENSQLENEANKLLGLDETSLYNEDVDEGEEDALSRAEETLPTPLDEDADFEEGEDSESGNEDDDEEDETPSGPRMFGGKKSKKSSLH